MRRQCHSIRLHEPPAAANETDQALLSEDLNRLPRRLPGDAVFLDQSSDRRDLTARLELAALYLRAKYIRELLVHRAGCQKSACL